MLWLELCHVASWDSDCGSSSEVADNGVLQKRSPAAGEGDLPRDCVGVLLRPLPRLRGHGRERGGGMALPRAGHGNTPTREARKKTAVCCVLLILSRFVWRFG